MGLWPYSRGPLEEVVDRLKEINKPKETAPIDQALLLEIIRTDPFIFLNLARG